MNETEPTPVDLDKAVPDENEPETEPETERADSTVYVAMTYGGQVLGSRHHESADAALAALTAAALRGFVVPAVVPPAE